MSAVPASSRKVRNADIVVSAAGSAGLIKGQWIRPGAVVVDVAINATGEILPRPNVRRGSSATQETSYHS